MRIKTFLATIIVFIATNPAFSEEKAMFKTVAVITGNEAMGRLNQPSGLFFDEIKKRLYVADTGNNRLISFDSDFKYLAELTLEEGLEFPVGLVRTREGQFFVINGLKRAITIIDLEKKVVRTLSISNIHEDKEEFVPGRMAIDKDNRLYVIDRLNKRLIVMEPSGVILREITIRDSNFSGFNDVRVDDRGHIYAIDTIGRMVYIFNEEGEPISKFGGREGEKGYFHFPTSIAVDEKGLIYVVDQHIGKVMVFDRMGALQFDISRPGFKSGELRHPSYIFIDKKGWIYIIDSNRVQIFAKGKG